MFHSFKLERLQSTSSQGTPGIALCHEYEQLIQASAKKVEHVGAFIYATRSITF